MSSVNWRRSSGSSSLARDSTWALVRSDVSGRAQFVARVEDELALESLAALHRGQEPVEDPAQPSELVDAALVDPILHVVGLGDGLDLVGDLLERAQRRPGEEEPEAKGEQQSARGDQEECAHKIAAGR